MTLADTTLHHTAGTETRDEAASGDLLDRICAWLARIGESSPRMKAVERYRRLAAMSDEELAARGLDRNTLLDRCFGKHGLY